MHRDKAILVAKKKIVPPEGYVTAEEMLTTAKNKHVYLSENRQAWNLADDFEVA